MIYTYQRRRRSASIRTRAVALGALAAAVIGTLSGCETDSFLDPSVTGRWEWTPTSVPILERISAIEDGAGDLVEYSEVTPADLVPDPGEYRIGPGDHLQIILYDDIDNRGIPSQYERDVDIRGTINLPQLGQISVTNRTVEQARQAIAQSLSRFVNEPLVSVVVLQQRQQTYHVFGAVETPGPYFISKPDFRLLEALTSAGRFSESSTDEVYIIRQIPLSEAVRGMVPPTGEPGATNPPGGAQPPPKEGNLIDLIDQISKPGDKTPPAEQPKEPPKDQSPPPATKPPEPKLPAASVMSDETSAGRVEGRTTTRPTRRTAQPPAAPQPTTPAATPPPRPDERPPVDLVDQPAVKPGQPSPTGPAKAGASSWVFVHGEWVQVKGPAVPPPPSAESPTALAADQLMTQRVIRVPARPLFAGLSQYNIVIRPGDIIHVPPLIEGFVYMAGQVQRPGPYTLPGAGKLTLMRAIASAGGLSSIAIPERVDIVRVVGKNRQAMLRLDYRAIAEGTMPDIYMRPDDVINVGTNFWAYPLAVLRNGLRTSYGFGFVIDRNFASDIFGPEPVQVTR